MPIRGFCFELEDDTFRVPFADFDLAVVLTEDGVNAGEPEAEVAAEVGADADADADADGAAREGGWRLFVAAVG